MTVRLAGEENPRIKQILHYQLARRNEVLQLVKLGMCKMFWRLEFYQNPNPRCTIISHCELARGKSNFQSAKFCIGIKLKHLLFQHQLAQQINSVKTFSLGRSIACLKLHGWKGILYSKRLSQWSLHYRIECHGILWSLGPFIELSLSVSNLSDRDMFYKNDPMALYIQRNKRPSRNLTFPHIQGNWTQTTIYTGAEILEI